MDRHHDFLQGGIARTFADAIDGALDLTGAALDGRQAVGNGQAEVVVAVRAEDSLVGVRHARDDVGEERELLRCA